MVTESQREFAGDVGESYKLIEETGNMHIPSINRLSPLPDSDCCKSKCEPARHLLDKCCNLYYLYLFIFLPNGFRDHDAHLPDDEPVSVSSFKELLHL